MKCNIGHTDRILRISIGITLIGLAVFEVVGPWDGLAFCPS